MVMLAVEYSIILITVIITNENYSTALWHKTHIHATLVLSVERVNYWSELSFFRQTAASGNHPNENYSTTLTQSRALLMSSVMKTT